jgi:hypothetical protein
MNEKKNGKKLDVIIGPIQYVVEPKATFFRWYMEIWIGQDKSAK